MSKSNRRNGGSYSIDGMSAEEMVAASIAIQTIKGNKGQSGDTLHLRKSEPPLNKAISDILNCGDTALPPKTEPISSIHESINSTVVLNVDGETGEEMQARWRSYPIDSLLRCSQCTEINHNDKTAMFKQSSMSGNFGVDCKAMDARSFLKLEGWAIAHIGA